MKEFGIALRDRARTLGLSDAEVARRAGITERRYGHYVTGRREPSLGVLLKICEVLATTPNHLLGLAGGETSPARRVVLYDELLSAVHALSDDDLRLVTRQVAAVVEYRRELEVDGAARP